MGPTPLPGCRAVCWAATLLVGLRGSDRPKLLLMATLFRVGLSLGLTCPPESRQSARSCQMCPHLLSSFYWVSCSSQSSSSHLHNGKETRYLVLCYLPQHKCKSIQGPLPEVHLAARHQGESRKLLQRSCHHFFSTTFTVQCCGLNTKPIRKQSR